MKYLKLVICVAVIAMSAACAKVGDPLPPLVGTPEKVQGVEARQTGYTVVLSWTNPRAHVDGSPLTDLAVVHVFLNGGPRRPVPAAGPGVRQSVTISVNDALGVKQTFFVVAETRKGRTSEPSKSVEIEPVDVPGQITELNPSVDEGRIRLTWKPPKEKSEFVNGYAVRRSDGGVDTIVTEPEFEDRSFQAGQTYTYHVTAMRLNKESVAVPGPSEQTISVPANDKNKPKPPATIATVVLADGGALLNWTPNTEKDLAEYRVYSGPGPDGPFTLIAEKLQRESFRDPKYQPGVAYAVTAVDKTGNESDRSIPPLAP